MFSTLRKCFMVLIILMAACTSQPEALPTLVPIDGATTAPSATATRSVPTLPPTFTPAQALPSETPTETATVASPTPEGFIADGRIFYIYNGDSIAVVAADASRNEIIVTFGVGQRISDLTISRDESLLAYVGPGAGSAREVYVSSRDGTYTQQVSCLGYADVRHPTWSPDGRSLAFFAATLPGEPYNLYIADFVGSNNCPTGNNQRQLAPVNNRMIGSIGWNPESSRVFYNAGGTYTVDLASGIVNQITLPSGFGTDFALVHSPISDELFYLRSLLDIQLNREGGALVRLTNTSQIPAELPSPTGSPYFARSMRINTAGTALLLATDTETLIVEIASGRTRTLIDDLPYSPQIAFSPVDERIAFTTYDESGTVEQIFLFDPLNENRFQLTINPEGSIEDLLWVKG